MRKLKELNEQLNTDIATLQKAQENLQWARKYAGGKRVKAFETAVERANTRLEKTKAKIRELQ